jgi:tRNA(Ile)-lysidine synthase TilS/MesJ
MKDALVSKIKELNQNPDIDCLLMFSGGKDSSYLLYFLSQELKLRVATITLKHKFLAPETLANIESFAEKYSTRHFSINNEYLDYCGNHFLNAWIRKPDEESLITLCTGCRLGLIKLIIQTAKKENINVIITGLTPFEKTDYRMKLVNYPKGKDGSFYFFLGYLRLLIRNPSLVTNWKALMQQIEEFYYFRNQKKIYKGNGLSLLKPFYDFLRYDEAKIVETLKDLNWQKASVSGNSYWRADCDMNAIRQFFHSKISGYNEQKYYYGQMLKDNLISKEYYEKNIDNSDQSEGILRIIRKSTISKSSKNMYEQFIKRVDNKIK